MSEIVIGPRGNDREIYVAFTHGQFVDLKLRSVDKATMEAGAVAIKLMVDDPDRGPIQARGVDWWPAPMIELEPAVMDGEDVITPAVYDPRYHVNVRLSKHLLDKVNEDGYPLWKLSAMKWTSAGTKHTGNKREVSRKWLLIELIDPATIDTPHLICAGDEP